MPDPPNHAALLAKHSPLLRFSAFESYRPDAVGVMTDRFDVPRAGPHWLKRGDGHVIASTHPTGDHAQLSLDYLRKTRYADGRAVEAGDYLDIGGRDYVEGARIRHANPGFANRVYGRVVTDDGGTWLQYWFFYFYNSKSFVVGAHEGDWEMLQIRIGDTGRPIEATFAQHSLAERKRWTRVRRDGPRPIVFVAVASHACYFDPGMHRFQRVFFDYALGDGESLVPTLVDITAPAPAWVAWPGRWGSSTPVFGVGGSPGGPSRQSKKWNRPSAFHAGAVERELQPGLAEATPAPPKPKIVRLRRADDHVSLAYRVPAPKEGETDPVLLVVAVAPLKKDGPPATQSYILDRLDGTVEHPAPLEDRAYEVRVVTVDAQGVLSEQTVERLPK